MRLTDEQKQQADLLRLTYTEMSVALATHIEPETYARHKQEMQTERDAWEAKVAGVNEAMLKLAAYQPTGRGRRLDLDESPSSGASGTGEDTHDRD